MPAAALTREAIEIGDAPLESHHRTHRARLSPSAGIGASRGRADRCVADRRLQRRRYFDGQDRRASAPGGAQRRAGTLVWSVAAPARLVSNPTFIAPLKRGFDQLWAEGEPHPRIMSIGLHPKLIGQASGIYTLREFIAQRIDIANWREEHQAEFSR